MTERASQIYIFDQKWELSKILEKYINWYENPINLQLQRFFRYTMRKSEL